MLGTVQFSVAEYIGLFHGVVHVAAFAEFFGNNSVQPPMIFFNRDLISLY
jgi:hypothetical protein